jgi:hypothetical protein
MNYPTEVRAYKLEVSYDDSGYSMSYNIEIERVVDSLEYENFLRKMFFQNHCSPQCQLHRVCPFTNLYFNLKVLRK